jgi:hypothetical protein
VGYPSLCKPQMLTCNANARHSVGTSQVALGISRRHQLTVVQIAAAPFWTLLCIGLRHGLGATTGDADERAVGLIAQVGWYRHISLQTKQELTGKQMFFGSQVPRLVSTGVTKCSLALLPYDLNGRDDKRWKAASLTNLGAMGLWTLGAPMIATIGCAPSETRGWSPCPTAVSKDAIPRAGTMLTARQTTRWLTITVGEVLLEVCLVIPLVYALRTTGEGVVLKRKLVASAMFSCRPM